MEISTTLQTSDIDFDTDFRLQLYSTRVVKKVCVHTQRLEANKIGPKNATILYVAKKYVTFKNLLLGVTDFRVFMYLACRRLVHDDRQPPHTTLISHA